MPLPFALIGTLVSLLSSVPKAIETVSEVVESLTGKPMEATTTDAAIKEIESLPPAQAEAVVRLASTKLEQQKLANERIAQDQGDLDEGLLKVFDRETASKIGWLRMATRWRIILRLSHVMLIPVYMAVADWIIGIYNGLSRAMGWNKIEIVHANGRVEIVNMPMVDLFAEKILASGSIYNELVRDAVSAAQWVVIAAIVGQSVEKLNGVGAFAGLGGTIGRVIEGVKGLVGRSGK